MILLICFLHCGKRTRWCLGLRQWARLIYWLVGQSLSLSGRKGGAESTEVPGGGSICFMLSDHRCLSSALYMAKPSTANTVAPTLALSQKVEFFRSAWAMCGYMAMVVSLV